VELVDRSETSRGLLQIHASNIQFRRLGFCPQQYEEKITEEDKILAKEKRKEQSLIELLNSYKFKFKEALVDRVIT
jgi:hypothetical protein